MAAVALAAVAVAAVALGVAAVAVGVAAAALGAVVEVELVALTAWVEAAAVTCAVDWALWPVAIHPASASTVSELATPVTARARFAGCRRRRRPVGAAGAAGRAPPLAGRRGGGVVASMRRSCGPLL